MREDKVLVAVINEKRNDNRKLSGKTERGVSVFIARFRSSRKIRNL